MTTSPVITVINATKVFGANAHVTTAIHNVSFEALAGELTLFLGPSGSGKTTLLTLAAGLTKPTSGTVLLFRKEIGACSPNELRELRSRHIGFIFQNFRLIDALTVEENVQLVLRFIGTSKGESRLSAQRVLTNLGIDHLARRFPPTLSQGEKQRVAIARAIANRPELIIADEPTASLETLQGFGIIKLLHEYAKNKRACVIVASHDLRIMELADRVFRLEDGKIVCKTPSHTP